MYITMNDLGNMFSQKKTEEIGIDDPEEVDNVVTDDDELDDDIVMTKTNMKAAEKKHGKWTYKPTENVQLDSMVRESADMKMMTATKSAQK